ncbi:bacterial regulatory helix-turn-helix, lysR family protein [Yersinia ruckeri]|uniref:LysR family transcriptional regulator n=1 Tax=Yersinia ruckeri TaxID=29486 RepID=UPI0005AC443F|nr:LysR family transcriptional regulator [Yersinia ruckeri]AJI96732.1 bacterial regulatory helix-turn-helix, lysR family protein [Yersinia ruckeri]MCW6567102.1 LysR family transcriptional regulator [Yersinia ruckeri]
MSNIASLKQLEILVKIIECGGLSEAATQLNISPSAVSKSLSHLESQLGTMLLKRTTRSLTLTDAGTYLYHRATKLLLDFDESLNTTAGFYNRPQGELRLTCSIAFGYSHLITLVNNYRTRYPDVDLYIDLNDNFVNLNESNFDIAIRVASTPPDNYSLRKLSTIHWAYCASPEYLKKMGIPTSVQQLTNHQCLLYPGLTPILKDTDEAGSVHVLKLRSPIQANSSLVLLKAVLEHQGIAYLPTYLLGDAIQRGEITPLALDGEITHATHGLYALYFPSRYSNPKVRSFIDFLVETLQPVPVWDNWITPPEMG